MCISGILSDGQLKFNTSKEHNARMYTRDLPNPETLSAVPHCRRNTWKNIELLSTIYEALHLPNVNFFPNLYSLLKVLGISLVMKTENECYENG